MEITVEKIADYRIPVFSVAAEMPADAPAREALLDRVMGPRRKRKSSEKLRRGRLPAQGLSFVARDACGALIGTVRLWNVAFAGAASSSTGHDNALLLGPLAVDQAFAGFGVGTGLMHHAIGEAARLGHGVILLVGDAPYYGRFGFSDQKTGNLAMPGPYERHRFLALELKAGTLDGAFGTLRAIGRPAKGVSACCSAAA